MLEKAILATITYFDLLDYPLTLVEIQKFLIQPKEKKLSPVNLGVILETLEESSFLQEKIAQKNGFYFLRGRERIIEEKILRHKLAQEKWKKTKKVVKILQIIPYIRMVAGSGSLALSNTKDKSDLDLLIIVKNGRIFLTRFLITFLVSILGMKRDRLGRSTKDKICLNHYLADSSLILPGQSLYTAYEYQHLVPLFRYDVFLRFKEANKDWMRKFLVNVEISREDAREIKKNKIFILKAKILEFLFDNFFGDWLEEKIGRMQKKRIEKDYRWQKEGGRIVAEERQLEFHPDSPEREILRAFNEKMQKFSLLEFIPQKDSGLK